MSNTARKANKINYLTSEKLNTNCKPLHEICPVIGRHGWCKC